MIRNQILGNEKVKPNSKEIETLKANFPQFFDESGQFLEDRFMGMLKSNEVVLSKEGYELKFLGKSYARYLSSTSTETFLAPLEEDNAKPENKDSENLYIIGDNLDALKHLLNSYAGKIKCIYLDPPYNTGSDGFVYPDNFKFNSQELAKAIGIEDEEADRILNLAGKSSHSAWLTFMYPRLILARELLSDDGVIFISIDDNEQANLKMVCDEILGEENFIANIIIQSNKRGQTYKQLAKTHEYCLTYTLNASTQLNELQKSAGSFSRADDIGDFEERELRNRNPKFGRFNRPNLYYPIYADPTKIDTCGYSPVSLVETSSFTEKILPLNSLGEESCWRWGTKKFENNNNTKNTMISEIVARRKSSGEFGCYEKYRKGTFKAKTIWYEDNLVGDLAEDDDIWEETEVITEQGSKELGVLEMGELFDFPKPTYLLKKLSQIGMNRNDIVLDFFSGSATTAHAVMQLNAEDGGNRKYIMVQLPEVIKEDKPAYQAGYRTIDEIGRERIRRAAKKIQEETGADIDYGFKTFKLEPVNQNTLNKMIDFNPGELLVLEDMVGVFDTDKSSGKSSILSTWLNEDGYGLTAEATTYSLSTYEADLYKDSLYIINEGIRSEDVMELVKRLETMDLDINRVVAYPYSIDFSVMHELKKNIKNLRNNKSVEVIERY